MISRFQAFEEINLTTHVLAQATRAKIGFTWKKMGFRISFLIISSFHYIFVKVYLKKLYIK